jgi:hypothetical protein
MELLLLVFRNNQPADFAGAVPSTIFAFHCHHLKYNCIIFSSFTKQLFPGSDEIVEDNRRFNNLKMCMKFVDKHAHLR